MMNITRIYIIENSYSKESKIQENKIFYIQISPFYANKQCNKLLNYPTKLTGRTETVNDLLFIMWKCILHVTFGILYNSNNLI